VSPWRLSLYAILVAGVAWCVIITLRQRTDSIEDDPVARVVLGDGFVGVILSSSSSLRDLLHEGTWTPSPHDIRAAEERIAAFPDQTAPCTAETLRQYIRQYVAYVNGGRRKILCNFVHGDSLGVRGPGDFHWYFESLVSDLLITRDGNTPSFELAYDTHDKSWSQVEDYR
jgi:hypothetical protein